MTDTALRALRGRAREELSRGVDHGQVMFAVVRDARRQGLPDAGVDAITADLRNEGLLPPVPRFHRDDGVWRRQGERKAFGKVHDAYMHSGGVDYGGWVYDVWIDAQLIKAVPETELEPCPLCPECEEEPAGAHRSRGLHCRGLSML